jgi:hypothetical protein
VRNSFYDNWRCCNAQDVWADDRQRGGENHGGAHSAVERIVSDRVDMALGLSLRHLIKRSKWALIGYTIAHSCYVRRRFSHGDINSCARSTHMSLTLAESVSYVNRTYEDYCRYGQLGPASLEGKTILEGGPGDNLGVALRFIAAGAAQVVAMAMPSSTRN